MSSLKGCQEYKKKDRLIVTLQVALSIQTFNLFIVLITLIYVAY